MCYELKETVRSSSALAPFQLESAPLQLRLNEKSTAPTPLHGAELAPRSRRFGVGAAHLWLGHYSLKSKSFER